MRKCIFCAEEISDEDAFCGNCGKDQRQSHLVNSNATINQVAALEKRIVELESWISYQKNTAWMGNSTWRRIWALAGYNILLSIVVGITYVAILFFILVIANMG